MKHAKNVGIVILVLAAGAAAIVLKQVKQGSPDAPEAGGPTVPAAESPATSPAAQGQSLPTLIDLGAGKCIPCKLMAPILEELKKEYAGVMTVQFFDVWQDPAPGETYGIRIIPTQIFLAPDGRELFRHEGFYSREDILKKWKDLGFDLRPAAAPGA